MKTDRHLYQLFRSSPEFLYDLIGRKSPGPCVMEQITIKGIARTMDGLFRPEDESQPLVIAEFQFQRSEDIYQRTGIELASVQLQNPGR